MKKIILVAAMLMSFGVSAEALTDSRTGQIWITDDNGAYTTDNSRLNRGGNTYFGTDGSIYERQGNTLTQVGGFKTPQQQNNKDYQINGNSSNGGGNQTNYSDSTSRLNGNSWVPWH